MNVLSFDKTTFNFHSILQELLETDNLAALRSNHDASDKNSIYKNMELTDLYQKLYEKLESEEGQRFYDLFETFIIEVVRPLYDEAIIYQKRPTHRIHFADGHGAARFHTDMDYGHHRCEINYTVPQTNMYDTNSIWIESSEGKGDYKPMQADVGEMVEFQGAYLKHGAKHNRTGDTRVSFDFRIMTYSDAPAPYKNKKLWEKSDSSHPLFKQFDDFGLCR